VFENILDDLLDALQNLIQPFETFSEICEQLNIVSYVHELTPKEYACQKFKNSRKDIFKKRYTEYIPKIQKNLPYQHHIYERG